MTATAAPATPVLDVSGLHVGAGDTPLVTDVSFRIGAGDRVGLIGESGSGKSLTALALLGLLPEGVTARGSATVAGADGDLIGTPERRLARVRGRIAAMVFQEPMTALNPVMRVGRQVAEALQPHGVEQLDTVRLPDPAQLARTYPHELSGGQRQRVVLAIALANEPALLICDEPTTALDVTAQQQVLDLVTSLVTEQDRALLFITHDLAVVASVCERVLVMYGGRIVESGPVYEVFTAPRHPYTHGLLAASDLTATDRRHRLPTIPGVVPAAGRFPSGCVFRNRCPNATADCETEPAFEVDGERGLACWNPIGGTR